MLKNKLSNISPASALFYILLGIVLLLIIYPVSFLIFGSFWSGNPGGEGHLTLDNYIFAFSDPKTYVLLKNSLIYALGSAIVGVSIATVLAFITTRTDTPLRNHFRFIPILPIILPGMVDNLAWIYLLSPNSGLVNVWYRNIFNATEPLFSIYTMYGMIWVMGISLVPLAYLVISAAFYTMDPSLEETARIAGSSLFTIFRKITIPLMLPSILSVFLLTFILAFESFETPAMIGLPARIDVFMSQIYQAVVWNIPPSYGLGTAYASIILVITLTAVYLYRKATRHGEKYQVITGKGYRTGILKLGKWRYAGTAILATYVFTHIFVVFGTVFLLSLQPFWDPTNLFGNLTFKHYETVLGQRRIVNALINSATVSLISATLVVVIAAILTYVSQRRKIKGSVLLEGFGTLPLAFPGFILGLGLLWTFLTIPIGIYGTIFVLILAFLVKYMPQGIRFASGALVQIQRELEESSAVTGANWPTTVRTIILPLLKPAMLSGWVYIFVLTFRELSSIIFLVTPHNEVIAAILWDLFVNGSVELLAATSIILTAFLWSVILIGSRLFKLRFR
jgi:iron(III) transport system permease protein|tara:strand:+ start:1190 stop:2884 length:1695 start_codon:yes stop_codon:yes gene_type:complete